MTTLHRQLAYLEAQGITPLMLRVPVEGALPSLNWVGENDVETNDVELYAENPVKELTRESAKNTRPVADVAAALLDNISNSSLDKTDKVAEKKSDSVSQTSVVNFNFSICIAESLVVIDEMPSLQNSRERQQLLHNIAQSLLVSPKQTQFLNLNWPIKDHRALDHGIDAANSFIQTWIESLSVRQHTRLVVLCGELAKQWFVSALDDLHIATVVVPASQEMFENPEKKSECWRLIRAYQSLVSSIQSGNN